MKTTIAEAKALFETYIKSMQQRRKGTYDVYDDDAIITSTRKNLLSISWTGKQIKEHMSSTLATSQISDQQYKFTSVDYEVIGDNVSITGHFTPFTPGQTGEFLMVIGYNRDEELKVLESHDGKPPEKKIRINDVSLEADQSDC